MQKKRLKWLDGSSEQSAGVTGGRNGLKLECCSCQPLCPLDRGVVEVIDEEGADAETEPMKPHQGLKVLERVPNMETGPVTLQPVSLKPQLDPYLCETLTETISSWETPETTGNVC